MLRIEEERVDCHKCGQLRAHNGACSRRQLWRVGPEREGGERDAKAWQSAETRVSLSLSVVARPPREEGDPCIRSTFVVDDRDEAPTEESSTDIAIEVGKGGEGEERGCRRTQSARSPAARFAVRVHSRL